MKKQNSNAWKEIELGEFVTFQRGFDITQKEQRPGHYPVISSSGINSYHSEYKVKGPGVVIGRKGTLGTVFYSEGDFWAHDTTLWVKDFHGNDSLFTYYFLKTLRLQQYDCGASNPTINRNHIHLLKVKIPDTTTQIKIARHLKSYDDLITNNQRRIQILEEMARSIYSEWFIKSSFSINNVSTKNDSHNQHCKQSEEWMNYKIKDILRRMKPSVIYTQHDIHSEGAIPVIDQSRSEVLGFHNNAPDLHASPVSPVMIFGDHTCKMQIMTEPFSVGPNVVPFKTVDDLPTIYVFHAINNLVETKEYKRHWSELVGRNINRAPLALAYKFSELVTPFHEQIRTLRKRNMCLRRIRELTLKKLMSQCLV